MANFLEALRTRVKFLAPELTEVYLASSAPRAVFPYCIINKLWEDPMLNSEDEGAMKEVRVQFTFLAVAGSLAGKTGDEVAEQVGKKVYLGLWPKKVATKPPLDFTDGYEMGRWPERFTGPTDQLDDPVEEQDVWRAMFDYTWQIGTSHV